MSLRAMGASPGGEDVANPRKRRKRADVESGVARQHGACATCRKLKVKCDFPDGEGLGVCSRCHRLQLTCLRETKFWTNTDEAAMRTELTIVKLERALEDVLEKLNMPALDLYASEAMISSGQPPALTRPHSPEPAEHVREASPGPLNCLMEATQLSGMRSQLRRVQQRRKGGMRRRDHDLVSKGIITVEEAETLLDIFKKTHSQHLYSASVPAESTIETIRTSSTVLFTAIMLVVASHIPGKEELHETCHSMFRGLVSSVMFDRFHSLDDIRGLCIAAFWQPYLCWKLTGLSIRMATELNLHHAFYEVTHDQSLTESQRTECLEKARLWHLLVLLDHQSSVTYGRPSITSETRHAKDFAPFLASEHATSADAMLTAQITCCSIMSRAFDHFGLEPKRTMLDDDGTVMVLTRFVEEIRVWKEKWLWWPTAGSIDDPPRNIKVQHEFCYLVLHSLALRGRPLDRIADLPFSLRPLALKAVEAAHDVLQHFIDHPGYREAMVALPLYLPSMIAYAVVFLLKLANRWHALGISINPSTTTIPLIESIIRLLRGCKAGKNHMVFSMASGFERMLNQLRHAHAAGAINGHARTSSSYAALKPGGRAPATPMSILELAGTDASACAPTQVDFTMQQIAPQSSSLSNYDDWSLQDLDFWSVSMGYDLLGPSGQGLPLLDFSLG
ncbi:Transcriptional activator of proteases prtT [Teratosphaeria destructans]|uniref:Transcriptional activator of proteases prtT n=1 Tax=Teratosphaeria destructans TaxID=418781 RepID=A0A9W7W5L0_9PEZI|nr:Transcriptional activator of proteases prtT [Teratosphaeria destructans]